MSDLTSQTGRLGRLGHLRPTRQWLMVLGYAVVAVVVAAPVLVQSVVAGLRFEDRLGTVPVEVGVVRNGYSVVDTGVLGSVYLDRTGPFGLGLSLRVTGPPDAGGTLASYVDPQFVQANAATLSDPERVAQAYRERLVEEVVAGLWPRALVVGLLGALLLPRAVAPLVTRFDGRRRWGVAAAGLAGLLTVSVVIAVLQDRQWEGTEQPQRLYPLPGRPGLSLGSPQVQELAEQVEPFVEKNVERLTARAAAFEERAESSITTAVAESAEQLRPRADEVVVVVEGDPQGSEVGTRVREVLYEQLDEVLGDALAVRTISGDVTSNGAVAEKQFVTEEVAASPDVPVVAVKGDHDSEATVEQLVGAGAVVPDLEVEEVEGLRFAGAADPDFKSLFGGQVTNPSGVSPRQSGERLRAAVDEEGTDPVHVLVHQNQAALGYLGLPDVASLRDLPGADTGYTVPREDGLDDVPPGSLTYGHWHESDGPWVVWNTGGEETTWTLVDQVGTSGGVEEAPTFNRFSTPYSPPLKPIELRLHYVEQESGLVTGFVSLRLSVGGELTVSRRTDVGVPRSG